MKKKLLFCAALIGSLLTLSVSAAKYSISNTYPAFSVSCTLAGVTRKSADILPETAKETAEESMVLEEAQGSTDAACFTYEELSDGTLRITGYDESLNTQNPCHVTIPASIDGKPVSVLGKNCLGTEDSFTYHLTELTISEGITTLESELLEYVSYDLRLINIPDSVISIAENAFLDRNSDSKDNVSIAIGCKETAYAYEYALDSGLACRILSPVLSENSFLTKYPEGTTGLPYYCHYRIVGDMYDYVVVEYLNMETTEEATGESIDIEQNEFMVLVFEKDSEEVYQCIDSSCLDSDYVDFSLLNGVFYDTFLSFGDWNFDGLCDLVCDQGYFGTGAAAFSSLFVYDADESCYVYVPEFSAIDTPQIREDKQSIYSFSRGGADLHYVDRYEYIDGSLCHVARLTQKYTDENSLEIIDERFLDGTWQIYRQETFSPQSSSIDGTIPDSDVYEQAEMLFVNDGYWDL